MDFYELVLAGDLLSIGIRNHVVDRSCVSCCLELSVGEEDLLTLEVPAMKNHRIEDRIKDPTLAVIELLYLLMEKHFVVGARGATKDVKHVVAYALDQKNKGSLEAESIIRAASTRVRFHLSTTPFYSGVRGVDV
ncbi:hypothetical protein Tco_0251544 [Tanacetum coccineum]